MAMYLSEIKRNSPEDVRRWMLSQSVVSGEQFSMLSRLFDSVEDGMATVRRIADELGVSIKSGAE